jgi:diphthamide biosynthesis protein 7
MLCITDANIRLFLSSAMVTVDTVLPADSLEFCPSPGFHDIFVCGTYKLEELSRTRGGQCLVFKLLVDSDGQLSWCAFL